MELVQLAYMGGFGFAAIACFASVHRVSRVSDTDTQRGLSTLLVLNGIWALTHIGRVSPVSTTGQIGFYLVGLIVGLATVGAWLYFCSAYTGHDYHRRPWIRRTAVSVYLGIVFVKLTNPIHGMYFDTTITTQPFTYVVVELDTIHWIVTGFSYALASVGFYLIYEMLDNSGADTRVLSAVVATTALPIVFYVSSLTDTSRLITLHYEPIGIAVFAIGVLFVVDEKFAATPQFWRTQIIDDIDEVIVVTDNRGYIRDYNQQASEVFPILDGAKGRLLAKTLPDLGRVVAGESNIVTICDQDGDAVRYFHVTKTILTRINTDVGQAIVCTDVTSTEQQRRELKKKNEQLEYKNEQLDKFANAITHELRNTLTIAEGYLKEISAQRAEINRASGSEAVESIEEAHHRMERIVTNLAKLASTNSEPGETEVCSLAMIVEAASDHIDPDEISIYVDEDMTIEVDRALFTELYITAVQFAELYGADNITVGAREGIITITTDGKSIPTEALDDVFSYGEAAPSAETGMLFPTMETIARSHGWSVDIDPTYRDGVRIEICDVETLSKINSSDIS
ncbi:histidine kinase N-terminal 7TM domain-containing protein [Halorubrum sp. RMP-47]|uniref:histidine kinase n=1 Tax=Halorubrum miltondacostae TaxID=3076378 RepID=A0ABD5M4M7_9EURY